MARAFSIRIGDAFADFLETLGDKRKAIENALDLKRKFDAGQLVEVNTLLKGQESDACIFGLKDVDPLSNVADTNCPIKKIYPALKKAENGEELAKFCAKCPWRDHDKVVYKLKTRYTNLFREALENAEVQTIVSVPTTDTPQERHEAATTTMVKATTRVSAKKEGWQSTCYRCGQTVYYHKSVKSSSGKHIPLDNLEERKTHDCPNYEPKLRTQAPVSTTRQEKRWEPRYCDCGIKYTDKSEMAAHVKTVHNRNLTPYEAQEEQA
ncbi:hypothetical protein Ngar_c03450 [Candidatus Nitrososphaera gargensis Ga9.2]|uniref:Uncharacterized protein n=1 Tax=Nitrososphaera gargensis (strain Ga9.2) TaxID=1237085 RepID=K0IEQ0_NITGG|nr:hypothetical protein [Candidatus Nitrososphaera gargensis]AFU57263.1 hypothetical protein Ngar_c03150 [Candidatus Nitrososphaera gargensis Ga9.2]AFU57293.1 hypothetical protein Ngar_c03450 [Candidatus Nitrososphaera gargensis Ga9.2]